MGPSNSSRSLPNTVIFNVHDFGIKNMTYLLAFNTGKYLEQKNLKLTEPKKCKLYLVGGFNPSEKIWVKMGSSSPIFGVNIKTYFKPPPSYLFSSTKKICVIPKKKLWRGWPTWLSEDFFIHFGWFKMFPAKVGPYSLWMKFTPPKFNIAPEKVMVGRWVSFWDCLFLAAMLNFRGVNFGANCSTSGWSVTVKQEKMPPKHMRPGGTFLLMDHCKGVRQLCGILQHHLPQGANRCRNT